MVFRRPAPDVVAARRWEIRRRYAHKAKVGKRTRSMAAIRIAELTRWLHDTNGAGAELVPSEQSVGIVRIVAHHMGALPDMARRVTAWIDRYAPWLSLASREVLIAEVGAKPLKWSADVLAWKLGLRDEQRTRLKIKTIGAIDCSKEQRAIRRKAQRAELMRKLRERRRQARVNSI